ncbi:6-phosphofructokinase [Methylotetracoccus oryzae]|uniref:6-phosphofructokinase n=1 Tax=Methylotetracoccus oryzae TaxID=1919059 RepID=UPI001119D4CA|nr:ATP-dependent 6-phosphofructokinase [Methylotetracoccus oryzae]
MTKSIGILTAGGDCPGLNAAIRAVGKTAVDHYGWNVVGFQNGFRGLMENRTIALDGDALSGILTVGGTILGTSRDKPHKMPVGGKVLDMTDAMIEVYHQHHLHALVCLGGAGTAKNAYRLAQKGINVINLPKTIDNDIYGTDISFGYDTALSIATEAVDRLHSTAHSHHRIIVVETMGHKVGWLALGAGIGGGADVVLIPEIAYDVDAVAAALLQRVRRGKRFSIVAVAEGAQSQQMARELHEAQKPLGKDKHGAAAVKAKARLLEWESTRTDHTLRLAQQLEELTGLESRVTILGYVQRGGTPTPADRVLATRLGTACAALISQGHFGVLVAARGDHTEAVPLKDIVGKLKYVPVDHPWLESARRIGICLGEKAP